MTKINVAVIYGGYSTEHEVSKASAATILNHISDEKYNIIPVYITTEGKWLMYDGNIDNIKNLQWEKFGTAVILSPDRTVHGLLRIVGDHIKRIPIDVVFPVLHGQNGEDGTIQGLCEMAGIAYVGCGLLSSALAMDKAFTKIVAHHVGVNQAKYLVFTEEELQDLDAVCKKVRYRLGYPCFIKPANAGSSVGISKAQNKKELVDAILVAQEYDDKMLIEKAVIGKELECGVLGTGGERTTATTVGEILPAAEFYDFDAKYNNEESATIIPADISQEKLDEIKEKAIEIFKALDCRGLARVDFFLEETTDQVLFNEINTMPGFTDASMYPMLIKNMGLSIEELIDTLIDIALEY